MSAQIIITDKGVVITGLVVRGETIREGHSVTWATPNGSGTVIIPKDSE